MDRRCLLTAFVIGAAATAIALLWAALSGAPAEAAGWDESTISVSVDDNSVSTWQTVNITVSGSDSDLNESNNIQSIDVRACNYAGTTEYERWDGIVIGTDLEKTIAYTIPDSVPSGLCYIQVLRAGNTTSVLEYTNMYVAHINSLTISLDSNSYYQGEVMEIYLNVANPTLTQVNIVLNDTAGVKTAITSNLAVSRGPNYYNWTVPKSVKPDSYIVEAWLPAADSAEDTDACRIYKRFVNIYCILSTGKYNSNFYVPGETVTLTIVGEPRGNYTVNISRADSVVNSWQRVTLDNGGMTNLTYTFAETAADGQYNVTVIEEDGTVHTVEYIDVQTYNINIYPERYAFLDGESFKTYYTVQTVRDGSLAGPAAGTWVLMDYSLKEYGRGSFSTSTGSFDVTLPTGHMGTTFMLQLWYNDTASGRSTTDTASVRTGPLDFSVDTQNYVYQPGGVVVVTFTTVVTAAYDDYAVPGVTIGSLKVSSRKTGDWTVLPAYSSMTFRTDAQGSAQMVMLVDNGTEDSTMFKIEAVASKGGNTANSSTTFTVRKAADISATVRTDRWAYTGGQVMHITVDSYAPTVTGQLTYLYMLTSESYILSGQVLLMQTSTEPTLDWTVPSDLEGDVDISVTIYGPNGARGSASGVAAVYWGTIVANADPPNYRPNTTIKISYTYSSAQLQSPELYYRIRDDDYNLVKEGKLATGNSGSFNFKVPAAASSAYTVNILAYQDGRVAASTTIDIEEEPGYTLVISVDKDVAAPGETVKIHYSVVRHGKAPAVSGVSTLQYGTVLSMKTRETTALEGTLEYKVPSEVAEGPLMLFVTWQGPTMDTPSASATATITASKAPAGLAMSRSDILLMVLTVTSLAIGIGAVVWARSLSRKLGGAKVPETAAPAAPQPAPAVPPPAQVPPPAPPAPPQQYTPPPAPPQQYAPPPQFTPPPAPPQQYTQPPAPPQQYASPPPPQEYAPQPAPPAQPQQFPPAPQQPPYAP